MPVASVHLVVCYTATLSEVFPGLAVRHEEGPETPTVVGGTVSAARKHVVARRSIAKNLAVLYLRTYREAILHTRLPAASDSAMLFPGFPRPFTFI